MATVALTKEMIDFLAEALKMPDDVRSSLEKNCGSEGERIYKVFLACLACFACYLTLGETPSRTDAILRALEDPDKRDELLRLHQDAFLAACVLRKFRAPSTKATLVA